ncbi:MAG: hypothetical protein CML56_06630 [Rhodobacteraceae bacterium]|nr:hypothetical protein [Paracoccaceae bacterium]
MQNELLSKTQEQLTIIGNKINILVESECVKVNPVAVLAEVASSLNLTARALSRHKETLKLKKIT